nr:hypothetical protein [Deltaproteobacteria bacterium]
MTRRRWGLHLAVAMVAAGGTVSAQPAPEAAQREGTVVRVDGDLLVVDLGRDSGLVEGERVPVLRPITVRHPITGQSLRDRFPLGTLQVYNVGGALSVLRRTEALLRPPAVGDRVVSPNAPEPREVARPTSAVAMATPGATQRPARPTQQPTTQPTIAAAWEESPPQAAAPAAAVAPGVDAEERAVLTVFLSTLGQRPADRVARWTAYLREHRASPWTERVRAEIASLLHAVTDLPPRPSAPPGPTARGALASSLRLGDPARVALQVAGAPVLGGRISARRPGAERYVTVTLARDGDGFVRGRFRSRW